MAPCASIHHGGMDGGMMAAWHGGMAWRHGMDGVDGMDGMDGMDGGMDGMA